MTEALGTRTITAAVLVIGDEILSGRTKDKNVGHIAERLTEIGVDLREVRVVPDVEEEIVAALNGLRHRYTYVFTTGGIGPTHDDITADSVAKAFGVSIDVDPRARAMLLEYIAEKDLNEARLRMARIPAGADLIVNEVSKAPGFKIGNVIVMAGVPRIMLPMLEAVLPSNDEHLRRSIAAIFAMPGKRIGMYGLAFKEDTDDLRESPVIAIVEHLLGKGRETRVYDPHIKLDEIYGSNLSFVMSALPHIGKLLVRGVDELIAASDALVIAQKPTPETLAKLTASNLPLLDVTRLTLKPTPAPAE